MTTDVAVWYRVSTNRQDPDNQIPDVERFTAHHGYRVAATFSLTDTAFKSGGGPRYRRELAAMLKAAHRGEFSILVVWSLDRIIRDEEGGAEAALRLVRLLRERGCALVSVQEDWLNGSSQVQDVLLAFAGWRAEQEVKLKRVRVLAGMAKAKAEGKSVGRPVGAKDKAKRNRSGYMARWERERAAAKES